MRLEPQDAGEESTFRISVTNEGVEDDLNVEVMVKLPRGMCFMEGAGDSEIRSHGQVVRFQRIKRLPPGAEAHWSIVVRREYPTDHQLEVSMTSDATRLRLPTRTSPLDSASALNGRTSGSNPPQYHGDRPLRHS